LGDSLVLQDGRDVSHPGAASQDEAGGFVAALRGGHHNPLAARPRLPAQQRLARMNLRAESLGGEDVSDGCPLRGDEAALRLEQSGEIGGQAIAWEARIDLAARQDLMLDAMQLRRFQRPLEWRVAFPAGIDGAG